MTCENPLCIHAFWQAVPFSQLYLYKRKKRCTFGEFLVLRHVRAPCFAATERLSQTANGNLPLESISIFKTSFGTRMRRSIHGLKGAWPDRRFSYAMASAKHQADHQLIIHQGGHQVGNTTSQSIAARLSW